MTIVAKKWLKIGVNLITDSAWLCQLRLSAPGVSFTIFFAHLERLLENSFN